MIVWRVGDSRAVQRRGGHTISKNEQASALPREVAKSGSAIDECPNDYDTQLAPKNSKLETFSLLSLVCRQGTSYLIIFSFLRVYAVNP